MTQFLEMSQLLHRFNKEIVVVVVRAAPDIPEMSVPGVGLSLIHI